MASQHDLQIAWFGGHLAQKDGFGPDPEPWIHEQISDEAMVLAWWAGYSAQPGDQNPYDEPLVSPAPHHTPTPSC